MLSVLGHCTCLSIIFLKKDTGSCSHNNCVGGEVCLPSGETYTCKQIVCEENPRVRNAEFSDIEAVNDPNKRNVVCRSGFTHLLFTPVYGKVVCNQLLNEWNCARVRIDIIDYIWSSLYMRNVPAIQCDREAWCPWTLLFRAAACTGRSIKDAYLYGSGVTNTPQCKDGWNPNCNGIYRSHLLDRWKNVAKIAITVYLIENLEYKTYLINFDGDGSTKTSWFEEGMERLYSSPGRGLAGASSFKHFNSSDLPGQFLTIMKDDQSTDPCTSLAFSVFDGDLPECLKEKAGSLNPPYIVMLDEQNKYLFHQHIVIWAKFK